MIRALNMVLFGAVAAGLVAGARAQETISTAANAPSDGAPAAPAGAAPITLGADKPTFDDGGPLPVGPCGAVAQVKDGVVQKPDRNPHGEVWAGVGTSGYREVGGQVCLPIGDHAAVNIAVDSERIRSRGW